MSSMESTLRDADAGELLQLLGGEMACQACAELKRRDEELKRLKQSIPLLTEALRLIRLQPLRSCTTQALNF